MRSWIPVLALIIVSAFSQQCSVSPSDKVDCGHVGTSQLECQQSGCCWSPASDPNNQPWCFYPSCPFNTTVSGNAPFSTDEVDIMKQYFFANIDINGQGGVVASPDDETPGGSYYFHWERDGALTIQTLIHVTEDSSTIVQHLKNYAQWVLRKQVLQDPNGIDIRTEPKYLLPDGGAYTGSWCRPQNDGPALRAVALMDVASTLADPDYIKEYLWTGDQNKYNGGAIKYDLDYILEGWNTESCDLWEEIRSNDFFWNRFWFVRALIMGADFATSQGDAQSAETYTATAQIINSTLLSAHYNGQYLYEEATRTVDGSVIVGLNDGYTGHLFAPSSAEVAGTIASYNKLFCNEYAINRADNSAGIPGILYGRYSGDIYAGGNPWVLTTAALARLFYRAGAEVLSLNSIPEVVALKRWATVLNIYPNTQQYQDFTSSPSVFAQKMVDAGDAVLLRIRHHVEGDGFHLAEQLDRNKGLPTSATDLTWSYAETLKAMKEREGIVSMLATSNVLTSN